MIIKKEIKYHQRRKKEKNEITIMKIMKKQ